MSDGSGVSASRLLGRGSIYRVLSVLSTHGEGARKVSLFFSSVFFRELERLEAKAFLSHIVEVRLLHRLRETVGLSLEEVR